MNRNEILTKAHRLSPSGFLCHLNTRQTPEADNPWSFSPVRIEAPSYGWGVAISLWHGFASRGRHGLTANLRQPYKAGIDTWLSTPNTR
jgi:hypothetical protein